MLLWVKVWWWAFYGWLAGLPVSRSWFATKVLDPLLDAVEAQGWFPDRDGDKEKK